MISPPTRKAQRRHWKSTKNRPTDIDANWTPFRAAEKKYKAKFPPPDLSAVLDLASLRNANPPTLYRPTRISADAFILPDVPGLVLLPAFVSPRDQRHLVEWSLRDHARPPNETNLDAHYVLPTEGIWNAHLHSRTAGTEPPLIRTRVSLRVNGESISRPSSSGPRQLISNDPASLDNITSLQSLQKHPPEPSTTISDSPTSDLVPKLRWANIGWLYHWGSKQYDFSRGKGDIDPFVRDLCKRAVGTVPWEEVFGDDLEGWEDDDWRTWKDTYDPDAGIVNFYQSKDTLMAHVDRSEVCATSPLVSISLGNAAIFLIGGLTRDVEPIPLLLRSGDVLIMSGPACRRAYHGVPRILENTLPGHFSPPSDGEIDWEPYKDYMRTTRININVRQVFPIGFDPRTLGTM